MKTKLTLTIEVDGMTNALRLAQALTSFFKRALTHGNRIDEAADGKTLIQELGTSISVCQATITDFQTSRMKETTR